MNHRRNLYSNTCRTILVTVFTVFAAVAQVQGHPTHRFSKLSVRKALNLLYFSEGIFISKFRDMGNLRHSIFGLMSFWVPRKGHLRFSERK